MNYSEHLQWCKDRAHAYVRSGDVNGAWKSMVSDLNSHSETADHSAIELVMMLLMAGHLSSADEMTKFIDGFN